jgi:hypothetical protein
MENLKVNEIMARVLFDEYLREGRDIGRLTPEEMARVTRISVEDCSAIIEKAKVWAETSEKQAAELAALEAQAQEAQAQEAEEKAKEAEEAGQTTEQAPTEG